MAEIKQVQVGSTLYDVHSDIFVVTSETTYAEVTTALNAGKMPVLCYTVVSEGQTLTTVLPYLGSGNGFSFTNNIESENGESAAYGFGKLCGAYETSAYGSSQVLAVMKLYSTNAWGEAVVPVSNISSIWGSVDSSTSYGINSTFDDDEFSSTISLTDATKTALSLGASALQNIKINGTVVTKSSSACNITEIPVTVSSTATQGAVTVSSSSPSGGNDGDIWFKEDNTTVGTITGVSLNSTSVATSGIANITRVPITVGSTATTGSITVSSSDPSGGSSGDIWLKYDA